MKEIEELKELLAHVDDPTRAEVIRRCAHYEKEIKHFKEQYRQLQEHISPVHKDIDELASKGRASVMDAIGRAGKCTLFYSRALRKFSAVTQEVRLERHRRNEEFVGCYAEGYDRLQMMSDIYDAIAG